MNDYLNEILLGVFIITLIILLVYILTIKINLQYREREMIIKENLIKILANYEFYHRKLSNMTNEDIRKYYKKDK